MLQRRLGLALLALVGASPFAVVLGACSKNSAPSDGTPSAISASALSSSPASSADVSATPTAASASIDAESTASAAPASSALTRKQKCENLRAHFEASLAKHRSCSSDADCIMIQTGCGLPGMCGIAVAASGKSDLDGESDMWDRAQCAAVLATPCATCAAPPAPKCVGHACK